jgi:hypothetical protein
VLESLQGGFSPTQLVLTYTAEAAVPVFLFGLYAVQRPYIGGLGLLSAIGSSYAYAYVFFTGTVLLALVHARDRGQLGVGHSARAARGAGLLSHRRGGAASRGAAALDRRRPARPVTPLPGAVQTLSTGVRDLAFVGMGLSLLTCPRPPRVATERSVVHVHA